MSVTQACTGKPLYLKFEFTLGNSVTNESVIFKKIEFWINSRFKKSESYKWFGKINYFNFIS